MAPNRLQRRALVLILLAGMAGLIWLSLHIAGTRIYQVDECAEVYAAIEVAKEQGRFSPSSVGLLQLLLSGLARGATRSADLFTSARFVALEVFWLNVVLLALATGRQLKSGGGLLALLGAATLAPLWDYGLEIRHDNLLLTGLLLTWCVIRVRPSGVQSYLLAGALAVVMQFSAHKAFAYVIPLSLALLIFPPPGHRQPRWKLGVAWAGGAVAAYLILKLVYGFLLGAGTAGDYSGEGVGFVSKVALSDSRFWPGRTLARLLGQTPLLLALLAAAGVALIADLRLRGRSALTWESPLPEALLCAGGLGILLINPTPYPYNLLHVVPYAFLFAHQYATRLVSELEGRPALWTVAGAALAFTHLAPFGVATARHLEWPNERQTLLMRYAEELTAVGQDPVYDGTGMVPTRPIVHPEAFLHSLTVRKLRQQDGLRLRDLLAARPAAVFIPNYRTDWLTEEDQTYIRDHYVSLADDFWVLGKALPRGGGEFEIIRPGRYRLSTLKESRLAGTYSPDLKGLMEMSRPPSPDRPRLAAQLDGKPATDGVVELTVGKHRIETDRDTETAVVWVGPKLDRPPLAGFGDHRRLFWNWY